MVAPAAERNRQAILDVVLPLLPREGDVLEIASGWGQHIAALAAHRPDLIFHPTEPDPTRRAAIDDRCRGLPNVAKAGDLDACAEGWAKDGAADAILLVNLLHLISEAQMAVLLDEASRALRDGGLFAIYGPFLRDGVATSPGDAQFDQDIRANDPDAGYKDVAVVETVLQVLGFQVTRRDMPANNLMLLGRKAGVTL